MCENAYRRNEVVDFYPPWVGAVFPQKAPPIRRRLQNPMPFFISASALESNDGVRYTAGTCLFVGRFPDRSSGFSVREFLAVEITR